MNAKHLSLSCLFLGLLVVARPARAEHVVIQVESLAPENGLFLSPMWVGFHNGSFDMFDAGKVLPAGGAMERAFEDGDVEALQDKFAATTTGGVGGFIIAPTGYPDVPVIEPGEQGRAAFELDPKRNRYMSFAAMLLPSNDAFIANDGSKDIELFTASGKFKGKLTFTILGADVWDAGTEMNTETDAAFLNQNEAGDGQRTTEPVKLHPGFIGFYANPAAGSQPVILGATLDSDVRFDRIAADFTRPNAVIARITVIPEPATAVLLLAGGLALLRKRPA